MRSLRAEAVVLLLRLMRRRRIYATAGNLLKSIAKVRRLGPARPTEKMKRTVHFDLALVDGREIYTLRPKHTLSSGKHVFYLHGGAFVRPIAKQHWQFLEQLVRTSGCTVTVALYPLAPEHQARAVLDFAQRTFLDLARQADDITLMGDSAGGGLALALALSLRDQGLRRARQLVLISPVVDLTLSNEAIPRTARIDPMLALGGLREAARLYAGDLPLQHPFVSPLYADLADLPPMTIYLGTHDILHHDGLLIAQKAEHQGCEVRLRVYPKMIHVWPILPLPEGQAARAEIFGLL